MSVRLAGAAVRSAHPGQGGRAPVLAASPGIRGRCVVHEGPGSSQRLQGRPALCLHLGMTCRSLSRHLLAMHPIAGRMPILQGAPGRLPEGPWRAAKKAPRRGAVLGGDRASDSGASVKWHVWSQSPAPVCLAAGRLLLAGGRGLTGWLLVGQALLERIAGLLCLSKAVLRSASTLKSPQDMQEDDQRGLDRNGHERRRP